VIDLEPVDARRTPQRAGGGLGARQVTVMLAVLLAAVLAGGTLAGHRAPEGLGHRLSFDEPAPAPTFDSTMAGPTAGAGESAGPVGGAEPVRPPHHIPLGWTWQPVGPLAPRQGNVAVWTGREVVYWGGDRPGRPAEGAAYDPKAQRWRRLSRSPLTNRTGAVAAWTGREVVVFGGVNGSGPQSDGAAYDPATDHWRMIAEGPLSGRVPLASAWTGTELLVVGARGVGLFDGVKDAAAYDPAHDTWRDLPGLPMQINTGASVWTGSELVVYGAFLDRQYSMLTPDSRARGAALDPVSGHWRDLLAAPLSGQAIALVWDGSEVIGWDHDRSSAAYDPVLDAWRALSDLPLEGRDCLPDGVAAGPVVFATHCGQAALFDPSRRAWQAVPTPASVVDPPVWTGDGLVEWLGPSGRSDDGTWFRPMSP
jgi:N-acetylneuraminic acid mutarotase